VRFGGHQRGVEAVPGAVVLEDFLCPVAKETEWSCLAAAVNWSQPLSLSLPSPPGSNPSLLPPPLTSFPHRALLRHWPMRRSLSLSDPDYSLVDWQRIYPSAPLACFAALGLLLLSGKSDHPIFLSRSLAVLLVADVFIMVVSCVVASMTKTLSRS
jgi:hypothetical protein